MNWTEIVIAVLTTVAIPLLTAVGAYLIIGLKTKNWRHKNLLMLLENSMDLIEEGVRKTYQTYVMKLKEEGNFTSWSSKESIRRHSQKTY